MSLAEKVGARKEVEAMSKPITRHVKVRKGKGMARKLSEVIESTAHLIRAIGVLVDALSRWLN
ncbi:hypothetical protein SAMN04487766_10710 [Actinomyces ruminicola]|uniref:Uncharacterized protein n=1 Tax=Actinomyces ruminicola TaxID=332524 RepID=A0A1G9W6X1_9ACTO|nr:hypothetical protein SAMN04487766_10710 [Actinomyces ruminicola]